MDSSNEGNNIIELLHRENKSLRNEIQRLQEEIRVLSERPSLTHEDRLRLKIMDRAPFTMWACGRHCRIVLWTHQCEKNYGYKRREALGVDFVELFVDEPEKKDARDDCVDIIDNDTVFHNFIAQDVAKNGSPRYMLTNCFRIWDDEREEWLQAEIAIEISDLEEAIKEHRNLREAGIELVAQKKRFLEIEKRDLQAKVRIAYTERDASIREQEKDMAQFIARLKREGQGELAISLERSTQDEFLSKRQNLKKILESLLNAINACQNLKECEALYARVVQFEKEPTSGGYP